MQDFRDYGNNVILLAVGGKATINSTVYGFAYVVDWHTCKLISSKGYAAFSDKGIRSLSLSDNHPAGLAMVAYSLIVGDASRRNEYLIIADPLTFADTTTYVYALTGTDVGSSMSMIDYSLTNGGIQNFNYGVLTSSLYIVTENVLLYFD